MVCKCIICGKEFEARNSNQNSCSPECKAKKRKMLDARRYQERIKPFKDKPVKCERCGNYFISHGNVKYCSSECKAVRQKNNGALVDIQLKARAAGMTYGAYVAKMGL